jgi:hypothetical protein
VLKIDGGALLIGTDDPRIGAGLSDLAQGSCSLSDKPDGRACAGAAEFAALVEKGSKPAGTIYFYRRIRLSTDCVISSGGSLRKPPLEIVFLLAVP